MLSPQHFVFLPAHFLFLSSLLTMLHERFRSLPKSFASLPERSPFFIQFDFFHKVQAPEWKLFAPRTTGNKERRFLAELRSQKKSHIFPQIHIRKQKCDVEKQKGEIKTSMHHVETSNFHVATQKSPVELTARSAPPSAGASSEWVEQ